MIYFIQCAAFVKIGYSANPAKRFLQVQTSNPHRTVLLGVMDGGKSVEADLHKRFSHLKERLEWFRLVPDLRTFIDQNARPHESTTKPVMVAGIPMRRGTLTKLAAELKINPSAITQWTEVPAERMGDVSRFTGIPLQELRPDIFAAAERAA